VCAHERVPNTDMTKL